MTIINQIQGRGYKLLEEEVVAKVLHSLSSKFDYVAMVIDESKNISKLSLQELTSSLEAHEVRVNRVVVRIGERVLHIRSETVPLKEGQSGNSSTRTSWCGSRGRGKRGDNKSHIQCFNCKKFSHVKANCWAKDKQVEKNITLVTKALEANNLFMACSNTRIDANSIWLVDRGCSNHMSVVIELFISLDESQKEDVRLVKNKEIRV
ncbi:uncharacterized protein LOC120270281 [Dioscorea cayenensis subsp. rotundata]|uniref:Uncharacterized protein LOC120270281 n=1 Tax=Dioscorea cayennensis subsp. rotundata TaxID=55577 RepID=A0AB40C0R0_DIOCR|nr:uncharacterized protein LOC120270281 [Dioscorea cayenensis subsp. rotundata]